MYTKGNVKGYHMYHIYPKQILFTKLITPLKFDEYMEIMSHSLCSLERDYGD